MAANPSKAKLPKNCQYLKEVATNQTHIRKSIDSIVGNNFDTDFAVPTGERFTSYKASMLPENVGTYGVTINLKYPDNSVSTAFRKNVEMTRKLYSLDFKPPTKAQPYQINLNINGSNKNAYTIAVIACK
ncbi:hypothetical protein OLK001_14350 [Synechocystis sp. LKSZ1]